MRTHTLKTKVLALATGGVVLGSLTFAIASSLAPPWEESLWTSAAWVSAITAFVFDRKFTALILAVIAVFVSLNWVTVISRC